MLVRRTIWPRKRGAWRTRVGMRIRVSDMSRLFVAVSVKRVAIPIQHSMGPGVDALRWQLTGGWLNWRPPSAGGRFAPSRSLASRSVLESGARTGQPHRSRLCEFGTRRSWLVGVNRPQVKERQRGNSAAAWPVVGVANAPRSNRNVAMASAPAADRWLLSKNLSCSPTRVGHDVPGQKKSLVSM